MNTKLPRLPSLPSYIASNAAASPEPSPPPAQQQAPVLGVAGDYEAKSVQIDWPMVEERLVYQTTRRWRACDVFVKIVDGDAAATLTPFVLSVFVYAVSQGARVLVASGRTYNPGGGGLSQFRPKAWVAAARTVAERYEVTARLDTLIPHPTVPSGKLEITIAASDEMTNPPDAIGEYSRVGYNELVFALGGGSYPPNLEVMSVRAVNPSASPRYLFMFDTVGLPGMPVMIWPLGPGQGTGVVDSVRYRARYAPMFGVSSTLTTYTPTFDDSAVSATVR